MTAKFDPPADIPHDEEFEWVNEWVGDRKTPPVKKLGAENSGAEPTARAAETPKAERRDSAAATPPSAPEPDANPAMQSQDAPRASVPTDVPIPPPVVEPISAEFAPEDKPTLTAHDEPETHRSEDATSQSSGQSRPGNEPLASLYMSFRGGVLQRKEGILRADVARAQPQVTGAGEAHPSVDLAPPSKISEPAVPGGSSSPATEITVASGTLAPGVMQHVKRVLATWKMQADRAAILDHLKGLLRTRVAVRRAVDHLKTVLHIQAASRRVLDHLTKMLQIRAASRRAADHLKKMLQTKLIVRHTGDHLKHFLGASAAAVNAPVAPSTAMLAAPSIGGARPAEAVSPVQGGGAGGAVRAHLVAILGARSAAKPFAAETIVSPLQSAETKAGGLKKARDGLSDATMPHVLAPAIAPDQLERDIADIIAVRDSLYAETQVSLAVADLRRRLNRAWTRVFH